MSGIDIAIIVTVSVLFAAALGYVIYAKHKKKGGCCDCDCCSHCDKCGNKAKAKETKSK